MTEKIPQIIVIVPISPEGKLDLKKDVKEHLGMKDAKTLFLNMRKEIVLSPKGGGRKIDVIKGKSLRLPEEVLKKLRIEDRSLVAMVQRKNAVAVKKFEVEEKEGDRARIVDLETKYKITRMVETNPMPEKLLRKLEEKYKGFKLRYDVKSFLKGRETLEGWKARKILGMAEPSDKKLRRELIRERLSKQRENGSWEGKVTITARNLRELADLGMTKKNDKIRQAVGWLLNRPQSVHNPGMFFVMDELVKEQERIIKSRQRQKRGTRDRFRKLKALEKNLVKAGDDFIVNPCGPRIMWPTALVLEALLKLGYERNERVQKALWMLMLRDWCECGYQHGLNGIRRKEPYSMEEIEEIEKRCMQQFKYAGISNIGELRKQDLAHRTSMLRTANSSVADADEYLLRMPTHLQGCEVVTTRAMSRVKNRKMRRFAEAHLWRFAGLQSLTGGQVTVEKYGHGHSSAGFLKIFASYDHPASKVVILRLVPWIVKTQNEDGSWGDESTKDSSTLAVICALKNVGLV